MGMGEAVRVVGAPLGRTAEDGGGAEVGGIGGVGRTMGGEWWVGAGVAASG